jgi:hypothetical protein
VPATPEAAHPHVSAEQRVDTPDRNPLASGGGALQNVPSPLEQALYFPSSADGELSLEVDGAAHLVP